MLSNTSCPLNVSRMRLADPFVEQNATNSTLADAVTDDDDEIVLPGLSKEDERLLLAISEEELREQVEYQANVRLFFQAYAQPFEFDISNREFKHLAFYIKHEYFFNSKGKALLQERSCYALYALYSALASGRVREFVLVDELTEHWMNLIIQSNCNEKDIQDDGIALLRDQVRPKTSQQIVEGILKASYFLQLALSEILNFNLQRSNTVYPKNTNPDMELLDSTFSASNLSMDVEANRAADPGKQLSVSDRNTEINVGTTFTSIHVVPTKSSLQPVHKKVPDRSATPLRSTAAEAKRLSDQSESSKRRKGEVSVSSPPSSTSLNTLRTSKAADVSQGPKQAPRCCPHCGVIRHSKYIRCAFSKFMKRQNELFFGHPLRDMPLKGESLYDCFRRIYTKQ